MRVILTDRNQKMRSRRNGWKPFWKSGGFSSTSSLTTEEIIAGLFSVSIKDRPRSSQYSLEQAESTARILSSWNVFSIVDSSAAEQSGQVSGAETGVDGVSSPVFQGLQIFGVPPRRALASLLSLPPISYFHFLNWLDCEVPDTRGEF